MLHYRLHKISIDDVKVIGHGELVMPQYSHGNILDSSQILGLYGCNDSGKSSALDALYVIEHVFVGKDGLHMGVLSLSEFVRESKRKSKVSVFFDAYDDEGNKIYALSYDIVLNSTGNTIIYLESEKLSVKYTDGKKNTWSVGKSISDNFLKDNNEEGKTYLKQFNKYRYGTQIDNYLPKSIFSQIVNTSRVMDSSESNVSLPLSPISQELLEVIFPFYDYISNHVSFFGNELWAYLRTETLKPKGILLFAGKDSVVFGIPVVRTEDGKAKLDISEELRNKEDIFGILNDVVSRYSMVMNALTGNFKLSLKYHEMENWYEIISVKNGVEMPLSEESYGILKMLLLMNPIHRLLVDPDSLMVIDEMDEGLFEYLLGDLLSLIREKGVGSLIFTAHNLIPLERLDRKGIFFTTDDASHRFSRITDIKNGNNLREIFFKELKGLRKGEEFKSCFDGNKFEDILSHNPYI